MALNLGQVAAILYGTTAPANTDVVWAETTTNDPSTWAIVDFHIYLSGSWQAFSALYAAVHLGASPPSDTKKIWLDSSYTPPQPKSYDSGSDSWKPIVWRRSQTVTADMTVTESDHDTFINVSSSSDVWIMVDDPGGEEFYFTVSRLGTGPVKIAPAAGVTLNGGSAVLDVPAQWRQVEVRRFDDKEFIVTGV